MQGLLSLLPAIAIAAALLTRRYPGERVVLKLRGRRERASGPRRTPAPRIATPSLALAAVRGGELIARSLAVRPPPHVLLRAS
ncbi:MAG TPA: hypothetical protein VN618_04535 [Solirubrobacteraceae bacterium]|nr:hypothetical protein [Solirubrobacteraceae bacterium]